MARTIRDDSILLLIDQDRAPRSFLRASAKEQAWRGRMYLATWVLTHHEAYAWAIALANDDAGESERLIADIDDAALLAGVRGAAQESE
jgi:hypothetical protein